MNEIYVSAPGVPPRTDGEQIQKRERSGGVNLRVDWMNRALICKNTEATYGKAN